jgi:hypothetical protein
MQHFEHLDGGKEPAAGEGHVGTVELKVQA